MMKLILAAIFVLATVSMPMAQGFNPGTVVGNVYQNPLSGCGYGYGLGCYPPDRYGEHGRHRRRQNWRWSSAPSSNE